MGNSLAKQLPEPGLGLHKFRLLRVIGRGSFGKVRIVEHRETAKPYALKYINKATCIRMRSHVNTIRERDMLEELDHPFVVNLRFSFQDEFSMFMVMDLMIGGDLRFHMMRRRFVEGVIKFWIAELACAISYLHANGIVHRDIKPDNILMDHRGHVALTDFNIATRIVRGAPHFSVAGTANYMAPEVVSGAGYSYSIDWWSLGVVMYECVYGRRPFRHKKSADELKRALLQEEIQFPIIADVQVSYDCISAMRGFLHKDPAVRLGCGPAGLAAVKAHPFFASINWPVLEAKRADPPFVPNPEQSNFDISHDLEEMLLEPEPLDAKKRIAMKRHKTPPEHACPEYHEITRAFAAFDYIEYERFKTYIETHGAITADDSAIAVSNTVLASVRLDGRPIFPPLDSRRSNSRASTAHIASRNSVNAATASTSSPDAPPRIATSILAISPNSTTTTSSSSTTTTMSTPVAAVATTADGTLEPPPIVPIDILLWNQLLPEQRSLAHRFCIKMAHDRQRHQHQQQLSRIGTSCSSSSPPPPASAVGNTFSQQHLRHPHRHYLVPTSASSLAVTGLSHTFSSHHVQQKQQNQQMPRPQPPQLPHISTSICLGEERQPATDGFFALREKRQSIIKRQRSADNLPCISHSLLPPPNIDDDDDLHRRHYQHQPLPQLPNLAPSQPL